MKTESPTRWRYLIAYATRRLKRQPLPLFRLGLILASCSLAIYVVAQQLRPSLATSQLDMAIALFESDEVREAQPLFAAVATNDPSYPIAQAYDALCRYELCRTAGTNDYRWFFNALTSPALQQATLPRELREGLAFTEIDARFQSRRFGSANTLQLVSSFKRQYRDSARLPAMADYELAAWFERGMQSLYKASFDENRCFHEPWTNGLAQLQQFVSLAGNFKADNYTVLQYRSLAEDLQVALAMLDGKPGTLAEISVRDPVNRLRYGLVRVGLEQKLHPEATERNLKLLADFYQQLQAFPASVDRARVERDLTWFAFHAGERLCAEAGGIPPSEAPIAAAKRAAASQYFQTARLLHPRVGVDAVARTSPGQVADLWVALFNSYCCEQDYARLREVAEAQLSKSAPGDLNWLAAKLYHGVALSEQSPTQRSAAAGAFEEVLASGLRGGEREGIHDGIVVAAGRWQMHLAVLSGDKATAGRVVERVRQASDDVEMKSGFLQDHAWVAAWVGTK